MAVIVPLDAQLKAEEYSQRLKEIDEQYEAEQREKSQQSLGRVIRTAHVLSLVLPPGWVAIGAEGLAEGVVGDPDRPRTSGE